MDDFRTSEDKGANAFERWRQHMDLSRRDLCVAMAAGAGQSLLMPRALAAERPGSKQMSEDLSVLTLVEASRAIRRGEISCTALVEAYLLRIERENTKINAIITPMREEALAQAAILDAEAKAGKFRSALHGMPIALKDNIDTAGTRTTNASALLKDNIPAQDARVVKMLKDAGAIMIAKANMAEFAVSPTSATSFYGPVRNPWNTDHVSGGSSGGSAAALAAHMCVGALGTDSGGSVRLPSAWCGTVGLRPTSGLISISGVGPGIPLMDSCGPMARTVEDVAMLLNHMTGYDPLDVISVDHPREDYVAALGKPVSGLRVGVPRQPFFDGLDDEVAAAVEAALAVLASLTAGTKDVVLKNIKFPDNPFTLADIYSYHDAFYPERADEYQPTTRNILQMCEEYFNGPNSGTTSQKITEYIKTTEDIRRRQRTIDAAFDSFDVVAMPTMKVMPPTVKAALELEYGPDGGSKSLFSIENTMTFNMLGLPALSLPCGFSRQGLPIGLMICGPHFSEARLLALGAAYERATPWRNRKPD